MHKLTAVYLGFDPGFTTGFAKAEYFQEENTLVVTNLTPILLNTRHPTIDMANPPIPCFGDFWGRVTDTFDDARDDVLDQNGAVVHSAVEDFVGGIGGNIQNTVNKLIGIIMGVAFSQDERQSTEPKVYRNKSRIKYLPLVAEATKDYPGISKHSKDALAHLLHRVFQENSANFSTMKIVIDVAAQSEVAA